MTPGWYPPAVSDSRTFPAAYGATVEAPTKWGQVTNCGSIVAMMPRTVICAAYARPCSGNRRSRRSAARPPVVWASRSGTAVMLTSSAICAGDIPKYWKNMSSKAIALNAVALEQALQRDDSERVAPPVVAHVVHEIPVDRDDVPQPGPVASPRGVGLPRALVRGREVAPREGGDGEGQRADDKAEEAPAPHVAEARDRVQATERAHRQPRGDELPRALGRQDDAEDRPALGVGHVLRDPTLQQRGQTRQERPVDKAEREDLGQGRRDGEDGHGAGPAHRRGGPEHAAGDHLPVAHPAPDRARQGRADGLREGHDPEQPGPEVQVLLELPEARSHDRDVRPVDEGDGADHGVLQVRRGDDDVFHSGGQAGACGSRGWGRALLHRHEGASTG